MGSVRFQEVEQDGVLVVEEIHKVVVHRFDLSDVEDPDLYAAQPLWEWRRLEYGKYTF